MQPDRPISLDPELEGLEPDLQVLADALSTAGRRARTADAMPSTAFARDLRASLLAELPASVVAFGKRTVAPRPLVPTVTWRAGSLLPSRRTLGLAMAATLVVGLVGVGASRLLTPIPNAVVVQAASATLVRDGAGTTLSAGTALREGDVVLVDADGSAVIGLAAGQARLAGGAGMRIDQLSRDSIDVEQASGRVWHRVSVPDGTTYEVQTGPVTWTALGTAFDLERTAGPGGGETVHAIGIEHAVRVDGPAVSTTVPAGRETTIVLAAPDGPADLTTRAVDPGALDDAWLVANARLDAEAGFDSGIMADVIAEASRTPVEPSPVASALPTPVPSEGAGPDASPSADPTAAPSAAPSPTPAPSPSPTRPIPPPKPSPTPKPTPDPTPTPEPPAGTMTLAVRSCPGGIVLDWSTYEGDRFDHYTVVRGKAAFEPPVAYPPEPPLVALDHTYATKPGVTMARDSDLVAGRTYWYRALAFSSDDRVIATSPAKSATARPVKALGPLAGSADAGTLTLDWTSFAGPEACFDYYKVVWSTSTDTPSYLGEHDGAEAVDGQATATWSKAGIPSGTYWFRVQAIRATELGKFVVAQTSVRKVVVP